MNPEKIYWILSHHQSPYLTRKYKHYKGINEEGMREILKTTDEIEVLLPPFKDNTQWVKENWGLYREGHPWLDGKRIKRPIPLELAKELNLWIVSPAFLSDHTSYFVLLPYCAWAPMGNPFSKGYYFANPFKEAIVCLYHFSMPHHSTETYNHENGLKLLKLLKQGKSLFKAKELVQPLANP